MHTRRYLNAVLLLVFLCGTTDSTAAEHVQDVYKACEKALAIPKVALLFLSTHDLPFRAMWKEWLYTAHDLLPVPQTYRAALAGPDVSGAERRLKNAIEVCRRLPNDVMPLYRQVGMWWWVYIYILSIWVYELAYKG